MINEGYKVEEICAMMRECEKTGVRVFEYNGLKIEMGIKPMAPVLVQTPEPTVIVPPEVQEIADAQTKEALAEEEFNKKQLELDQLLIDDPEGYFEAIKRGDLTDEKRA